MIQTVRETDPEIAQAIADEYARQSDGLELIASENFVSPAVMAAMDQLDPPAETNVYKIIATVAFFAGIAALGVAIYFQRRRRG